MYRMDAAGNLLHLYYGEKIEIEKDGLANVCEIMTPAITNQNGCSLIADTAQPNLCLDDVCLEKFGDWYRLYEEADKKSIYDTDVIRWNIVSADKRRAVGIMLQGETLANYSHHVFKTKGLDDTKKYHFYNRALKYDIHRMGDLINTMTPVHVKQDSLLHDAISKFVRLDGEKEAKVVSGAVMNRHGVPLAQNYAGTGYGHNTALYQDYDARIYFMEEV